MYLSESQNGAFSGDYQMTGSSISCGGGGGLGPSLVEMTSVKTTLAEPMAL